MRVVLDSNVVIYLAAANPAIDPAWIDEGVISAITLVETLGYHRLGETEHRQLEQLIDGLDLVAVSHPIIEQAIALRQRRRMSLGDSIIAATAITLDLPLVTSNMQDFHRIESLRVLDPTR